MWLVLNELGMSKGEKVVGFAKKDNERGDPPEIGHCCDHQQDLLEDDFDVNFWVKVVKMCRKLDYEFWEVLLWISLVPVLSFYLKPSLFGQRGARVFAFCTGSLINKSAYKRFKHSANSNQDDFTFSW